MKKEWKNIEGKTVRFDVGSTTEQAQAESMPAEVICFTTDNKVVFNGEYFGDGDSFFDVNATDLPSTSGTATFPDDGGERRALYDKLAAACADGKTIRIYLGNGSSGKLYAVACYSEGRKATNRSCFILYFLWGKELYYRFAQWNSTDATYTASASKFTIADASQVAELISRVAADETAITTNTADIATNTANIAALKSALKGIANTDCARVVITASGNYAVTTNLDALNDFSTAAGLYAITNARDYVYGHMLIGSDPMFHGTVQWLFGNWNVEDGKLMVSHSDGCVTIVYRIYLRSDAKWSDWKYYQQNFIKEADDSLQGGEWTYNHTAVDAIKTSLQTAIDSINTDKQKLWAVLQDVDERDRDAIDKLDAAVATNTTDIATNAAAIAANTTNIATNKANIATNTANIATNAAAIAANAKQIQEDYVEIEANTTRSCDNKNKISELTDNLRGHAEAITNLTSRVEGDETTIATNAANIATLNTRVLELGNFATENEAMNALADLSICANQQISVAHLNYTADNTTYSITMLQCLSFDYCRQIIFNRDKMKQRGIKFTDCNRTSIKSIENQQFMFGDRLEWYARENKYVLNQFGSGAFNHSYCQSIPTATSTTDGLMSKQQVSANAKTKVKVNKLRMDNPPKVIVRKCIPPYPKKGMLYYFSDGVVRFKFNGKFFRNGGILPINTSKYTYRYPRDTDEGTLLQSQLDNIQQIDKSNYLSLIGDESENPSISYDDDSATLIVTLNTSKGRCCAAIQEDGVLSINNINLTHYIPGNPLSPLYWIDKEGRTIRKSSFRYPRSGTYTSDNMSSIMDEYKFYRMVRANKGQYDKEGNAWNVGFLTRTLRRTRTVHRVKLSRTRLFYVRPDKYSHYVKYIVTRTAEDKYLLRRI